MCAQQRTDRRPALSRAGELLAWLGGGEWRELGERHERSTHALAGAVVVLGAALAWLVPTLAVRESAPWPLIAIAPLTLVFALLIGAITRATGTRNQRGRYGIVGRAALAVAVGVVIGELATVVMLAAPIDHRLEERALRSADSAPAVAQASASLRQRRAARDALDVAVDQASERQDRALVVARCEYHPSPGCPQTRITGVPGPGPETRTANELLADAQRELDNALAARDRRAPELDATISRDEWALSEARHGVVAAAGRGLGDRWLAMNDLTGSGAGALILRLLTIACCVLLYLTPLILGLWRGETSHDRRSTARGARERAELEADTAIAVRQAEVRREAEIMWAEHQLTQARLAIEAQAEIDRERQRRRVLEAFEAPPQASSTSAATAGDDVYLPIAAEAEAASRAITRLPAGSSPAPDAAQLPEHLPAPIPPEGEATARRERGTSLIPSIPDATKVAARWIRPLVPPLVARVIDTTTQPLRSARQVFEEFEEITFAFRRTHKVTVDAGSAEAGSQPPRQAASAETRSPTGYFVHSSREDGRTRKQIRGNREFPARDEPPELHTSEGARQLPPPQ